jgi:predicted O-methyltransferase YrrM
MVTSFDDVARLVDGIPNTTPSQGRRLYDFVCEHRARQILELGFAHGVSTCYLAAAVGTLGSGHVFTLDDRSALRRRPTIHELLECTGLTPLVTPVFARTTYTWELANLIERQSVNGRCAPLFDFCFIDGAHSWQVDGLAFFLVEKLLKPGGWILFDDLGWTFETSPTLRRSRRVRSMPHDERTTAQVGRVFDLLVRQHPGFGEIRVEGSWGWARKAPGLASGPR